MSVDCTISVMSSPFAKRRIIIGVSVAVQDSEQVTIDLSKGAVKMNKQELKKYWKKEENVAHMRGWDFSYIEKRYQTFENELPWDYKEIVKRYLRPEHSLLDIDTGGGEFLLSFQHPYALTSVTEGYAPNVKLCQEKLGALGIKVYEVTNYEKMPFRDNEFDIIINRHGAYDTKELYRILKPGGLFITQQVGEDNDSDLVEFLLPESEKMFPGMNLKNQKERFEQAGFEILMSEEALKPIEFYDVGALVWFARIIEWEFVGFSVDDCFEQLLQAQELLEREGCIRGNVHRYMIVARK